MQELREGGYPIEVRTEMLQSGIKGYCKMWNLEIQGQGYVNRPEPKYIKLFSRIERFVTG